MQASYISMIISSVCISSARALRDRRRVANVGGRVNRRTNVAKGSKLRHDVIQQFLTQSISEWRCPWIYTTTAAAAAAAAVVEAAAELRAVCDWQND